MLRLFADLNETTTPAAIQLVIAAAAAVALIDKKVLFYSTESFSLHLSCSSSTTTAQLICRE